MDLGGTDEDIDHTTSADCVGEKQLARQRKVRVGRSGVFHPGPELGSHEPSALAESDFTSNAPFQ